MTANGMQASPEESRLLASLAMAMVERPRASLQELAKAVGVSKATLYRFCRTREQLVERLITHSTAMITEALRAAELEAASPLDAFRRLNANNLEHKELTSFLIHYWKEDGMGSGSEVESDWEVQLDAFFLRGQQAGAFRIDIPAPAMSEIWVGMLLSLVDAERRGRVARTALPTLLEQAFLNGTSTRHQ